MTGKQRFNSGLGFGVIMAIYLMVIELLTQDGLTGKRIAVIVLSGMIGGAVAGFLFGWIISWFSNSKFLNESTKIETEAGEMILFESSANHFKGLEGVGGKLYLTDKRLVFKSHKFNFQNHQLILNKSEISEVSRYKVSGLVNKGISITTGSGKIEKFVVEHVEEWVEWIDKWRRENAKLKMADENGKL